MAFERPTLPAITTRIETDLRTRLGLGALLPRSVLKVLARIEAGATHLLHGHLEYVTQQIIPDTADREHLDRWASIFGITRLPAFKARGFVDFTGVNGSFLAAGALFQSPDGVRFKTDNNATIVGGVAAVICSQVAPVGTNGNIEAGTIVTLLTPAVGFSDTNIAREFVGGRDEETDPVLLARLLVRIQTPPQGGAEIDYEVWARTVAGVTRAFTLPLHFGVGSVGLTFVRDDDSGSIIPDAAEVQEVQDAVDALRPVAVGLFTVFAPVAVPQAFTIDLTTTPASTDSAEIQAAITANLTQLILDEAEPGGTLQITKVREAISNAEGETDHILSFPSADVTVAAGELMTLGTITYL